MGLSVSLLMVRKVPRQLPINEKVAKNVAGMTIKQGGKAIRMFLEVGLGKEE